jgi:hypothetical protein
MQQGCGIGISGLYLGQRCEHLPGQDACPCGQHDKSFMRASCTDCWFSLHRTTLGIWSIEFALPCSVHSLIHCLSTTGLYSYCCCHQRNIASILCTLAHTFSNAQHLQGTSAHAHGYALRSSCRGLQAFGWNRIQCSSSRTTAMRVCMRQECRCLDKLGTQCRSWNENVWLCVCAMMQVLH